MTLETLEKVISRIFEYAEGSCSIAWQGGEPTLAGLPFFRTYDRTRSYPDGIPMGQAFPNEHVFLLDGDDKEITSPNVVGEVCVRGSANRYGLQVIFHGCTIPRGWERMYPNYVGSEAVLASENVYFSQRHCDLEGFELTMHPFSRNAIGSMDWGGVIMKHRMGRGTDSGNYRRTTDVFEMATAITNQASVQCIAVQPDNIGSLPQFEKDFLKTVPAAWDETRFIDGYPTKYVVMARRHGNDWYVGGLNGTGKPMTLTVCLPMFAGQKVKLYADNKKKKGEAIASSALKTVNENMAKTAAKKATRTRRSKKSTAATEAAPVAEAEATTEEAPKAE